MAKTYDIAVIGGGIIGAASAMALSERTGCSLVLLEAEEHLAAHQTGHNSGVIHSGLYYKPGSLKARNCVEGREELYRFCGEHGIAHERCGKLVVAVERREIPRLVKLEERGRANGIEGIKRLEAEELKDYEPHVSGVAGLHVPVTGIVDYAQATQKFAEIVRERGGEIRLGERLNGMHRRSGVLYLETAKGVVQARNLINCAGLQSDRVAQMCGVEPSVRIVPFRGEYYELKADSQYLVRNLIYPVPDPQFPFLGVHFTRMIQGGIEAGPNAVLNFKREGYGRFSFSLRDAVDTASYGGFWRMASRHWRMGIGEMHRSLSTAAFVRALQRLLPELRQEDVERAGQGVRAQALDAHGNLLDDFSIVEGKNMIHVLNAPSPAATASISIGKEIAAMAARNFGIAEAASSS